MATISAAGNGNFLTGGTWVGGVVPTTGDTAEAAGYTVAVDGNVTCDLLTNTGGGGFTVASGGITINAAITAGAADCLVTSHATGTVTINGAVTGSAATASADGIRTTAAGTIALTGNVTGGGATSAYGINLSGGTLTITGNVTGGTGTTAYGLNMAAGTTATITGNVYGKAAHGISCSVTATLTVNGICAGSDTDGRHGIDATSWFPTITVTTAIGGAAAASRGMSLGSSPNVTVGTAIAGTGDAAFAIHISTTAGIVCRVNEARGNDATGRGGSTGTSVGAAIYSRCNNANARVSVRRVVSGALGACPVLGYVTLLPASDAYVQMRDQNLRTVNLRRGGVPTLGGRIGRGD